MTSSTRSIARSGASTSITGYWATGAETPDQAAEALVDLVAERLELAPGQAVCDIGCGYGATAQILAERHGVQRHRPHHVGGAGGGRRGASRPPALEIRHRDWLDERSASMPLRPRLCDREQRAYGRQGALLRRGLSGAGAGRPAGGVRLADAPGASAEVRWLLEPICREGRLPGMGDETDYLGLARGAGLSPLPART